MKQQHGRQNWKKIIFKSESPASQPSTEITKRHHPSSNARIVVAVVVVTIAIVVFVTVFVVGVVVVVIAVLVLIVI